MRSIGQPWSRWQWASVDTAPALDAEEQALRERWDLAQWVGAGQGHVARSGQRTMDASGGFSGCGVPDSGGSRWAEGYLRSTTSSRQADDASELMTAAA